MIIEARDPIARNCIAAIFTKSGIREDVLAVDTEEKIAVVLRGASSERIKFRELSFLFHEGHGTGSDCPHGCAALAEEQKGRD